MYKRQILIYAVLYIPIVVMMVFSFNDQRYNYYWNGFTTQWYGKLFHNSALIGSLWYSLIIAVLDVYKRQGCSRLAGAPYHDKGGRLSRPPLS